jgi:DNA polymerase-3 subunit alpha
MNFCHLHLHTEHSLLDGCGSAKQYLSRAKELGFEYLACTDHANIDGAIKFQSEAKKMGIKPIVGCELYIVPDMAIKTKEESRYHLTVLIKDEPGFVNLCKILTRANLKGFYHKPRTDFRIFYLIVKGWFFYLVVV